MALHWVCWNIAFHHMAVEAKKSFAAGWLCFGVGSALLCALSEMLGGKSPWQALRAGMPQIWIKHHQGTNLFWLTAS